MFIFLLFTLEFMYLLVFYKHSRNPLNGSLCISKSIRVILDHMYGCLALITLFDIVKCTPVMYSIFCVLHSTRQYYVSESYEFSWQFHQFLVVAYGQTQD